MCLDNFLAQKDEFEEDLEVFEDEVPPGEACVFESKFRE